MGLTKAVKIILFTIICILKKFWEVLDHFNENVTHSSNYFEEIETEHCNDLQVIE